MAMPSNILIYDMLKIEQTRKYDDTSTLYRIYLCSPNSSITTLLVSEFAIQDDVLRAFHEIGGLSGEKVKHIQNDILQRTISALAKSKLEEV